MPFLDRYWWLRVVAGVVAAAVCFLIIANGLLRDTGSDFVFSRAYVPCILIALSNSTFDAHGRFRRRMSALRGDREAVPRAAIIVNSVRIPDVSNESYVLSWTPTPEGLRERHLYIRNACIVVLVLLILNTALLLVYFALPVAPVLLSELLLLALTLVTLSSWQFSMRFYRYSAQALRRELNAAFTLSADTNGITLSQPGTNPQSMQWHEMRLLEVVSTTEAVSGAQRYYRLYSSNLVIAWPAGITSFWIASPWTREQLIDRHQQLVNLIVARTGLTPRTFDKRLQPREASEGAGRVPEMRERRITDLDT